MTKSVLAVFLASACGVLAQAPATNYDEAKVPAYKLPELLMTNGGQPVKSAAHWQARRAEIRSVLETQMFGRSPGRPVKMSFESLQIDRTALGGKAVRKDVALHVEGKTFNLLLYLPAHAPRPAPVFVGLGFHPNHTVSSDPGIRLAGEWELDKETKAVVLRPQPESTRGSAASRWQVEMLLSRGYGLATVYYGDIEPDVVGGMKDGIRGVYLENGQQAPGDGEWGAIAAWAWGLSRAIDYLATDKDVDDTRLTVVGHSRLGKAALWAGATDLRPAMVISNESGEGGAAISRRVFGETVADLNTRFPHWFCGNYKRYNGREDSMPFDSHMLLALVAPRPLYVASAEDDRWADPRGEFLAAVAASEAYEVLGKKGVGTAQMPPVNQPVGDTVRYHVRTGAHDITAYDWQQYLDFADRHLRK